MSPVIQRFAASLLPFLVTVLTAFTVIPEAAYLEPGTWIQFAGLVVATAVSLLLPLVPAKWAGAAKTGGNVAVAVLAAIITYVVQGDFTIVNIVLVVIAGINSLASEIGVQIRTSAPANG